MKFLSSLINEFELFKMDNIDIGNKPELDNVDGEIPFQTSTELDPPMDDNTTNDDNCSCDDEMNFDLMGGDSEEFAPDDMDDFDVNADLLSFNIKPDNLDDQDINTKKKELTFI